MRKHTQTHMRRAHIRRSLHTKGQHTKHTHTKNPTHEQSHLRKSQHTKNTHTKKATYEESPHTKKTHTKKPTYEEGGQQLSRFSGRHSCPPHTFGVGQRSPPNVFGRHNADPGRTTRMCIAHPGCSQPPGNARPLPQCPKLRPLLAHQTGAIPFPSFNMFSYNMLGNGIAKSPEAPPKAIGHCYCKTNLPLKFWVKSTGGVGHKGRKPERKPNTWKLQENKQKGINCKSRIH